MPPPTGLQIQIKYYAGGAGNNVSSKVCFLLINSVWRKSNEHLTQQDCCMCLLDQMEILTALVCC